MGTHLTTSTVVTVCRDFSQGGGKLLELNVICARDTPHRHIAHAVSFNLIVPREYTGVRLAERSNKSSIGLNYYRDDVSVRPGTSVPFTFYYWNTFIRMWIHRSWNGTLSTTFESGSF